MANLTPKQQRFVDEYLIDLNAKQSAIRAGYSEKTAREIGYQLLQKPDVEEAIIDAKKNRQQRIQLDSDYVLRRLAEIDQMDALDIMDDKFNFKPISEWPKIWRQFVSNIESLELSDADGAVKKIKWPDKVKNLELLGKHIAVGAFKDKVEMTGKDGEPMQTNVTIATQEQIDEAIAKAQARY